MHRRRPPPIWNVYDDTAEHDAALHNRRNALYKDRVANHDHSVAAVVGLIWVVVYGHAYGPSTFLWISDATLLLVFIAIIAESRLLASIAALTILPELAFWWYPFWVQFFFGVSVLPNLQYMFDPHLSILLRGWSFAFHTALPFVGFTLVPKLGGYHRDALVYALLSMWGLLVVSRCCTDPAQNINLVFSEGSWILRGLFLTSIATLTHFVWLYGGFCVLALDHFCGGTRVPSLPGGSHYQRYPVVPRYRGVGDRPDHQGGF